MSACSIAMPVPRAPSLTNGGTIRSRNVPRDEAQRILREVVFTETRTVVQSTLERVALPLSSHVRVTVRHGSDSYRVESLRDASISVRVLFTDERIELYLDGLLHSALIVENAQLTLEGRPHERVDARRYLQETILTWARDHGFQTR